MAEDGRVSIFVGRRGARTSDPEEWLALIRDERLRREDTVAVRRDGDTAWMAAGDVPELRPLFDRVESEAPQPNVPRSPPAPVEPIVLASDTLAFPPSPMDGEEGGATAALPGAGFASEATPAPAPRRAPPPQPRRGGGCATAVWITLLVMGLGVFLLVRSCGGEGDSRRAAGDAAAIASAEPVDRFVARLSRVRVAPSATSIPPVGELNRGDAVTGVLTADPDDPSIVWMRLTRGRWADRYVWAANLDADPPPRLLGGPRGMRVVASRGESRLRPDSGSQRLTTLSPGDRIRVVGGVGGGWLEVLRPSGGVAYVREDALRRDPGAPIPETEAAAPGEEQPD